MISPVLNKYQFLIHLQPKKGKAKKIVVLPAQLMALQIEKINEALLQGQAKSLREPWLFLVPETDIAYEAVVPSPFASEILTPDGKAYIRPQSLVHCLVPHPKAIIKWIRLEMYELDRLAFSFHLSVHDLFIFFIDKVAEIMLPQALEAGDTIYYDIAIAKQTTEALINTDTKRPFLASNYKAIAEDVFEIPQLENDRPRINFNKLKDTVPAEYAPADTAAFQLIGRGRVATNRIIVAQAVYEQLTKTLPLSQQEENGGYLVGHIYRQPGLSEDDNAEGFNWVAEITGIVPAESAYGNSLLLLFTSETWSRLNQRIDKEFPNQRLLGWYHTHLFPASDSFGLSELDQVLHRQFFTKAWQVALLLNIDVKGERELRSFQKDIANNKLEETQYEMYVTETIG